MSKKKNKNKKTDHCISVAAPAKQEMYVAKPRKVHLTVFCKRKILPVSSSSILATTVFKYMAPL